MIFSGGKVDVGPILTTGAVPFRLYFESHASAVDQHCAKHWNSTGAALAKDGRSTAFQGWETIGICEILRVGAALI